MAATAATNAGTIPARSSNRGQHEEEAGEGKQAVEEAAQDRGGRRWPLQPMREHGQDGGVERKRRQ